MITNAQRLAIKAAIMADPVLAAKTAGPTADWWAIECALNEYTTTDAWKVSVPVDAADEAADYSTFDSIAAGKRDSWGFFLRIPRDFSRSKVRKWITDVWGNATAGSNAESILRAGVEKARRVEVIIGGTVKTTGTVAAMDRDFIGEVSATGYTIGGILA